MIDGIYRGNHPRVVLLLPGWDGPFEVEFIVDTGFSGDLTLPPRLAHRLDGIRKGSQEIQLAGGLRFECDYYKIQMERGEEPSVVEVMVLDGIPLLGTHFLRNCLFQAEIAEGGVVTAEEM